MNRDVCKILLVDDDEDDYYLTKAMLAQARQGKYELEWVSSYEKAGLALRAGGFDAVLMDYDLGLHNGLALIRNAVIEGCQAPIILYTGRGSYEVDLEAMQAGATLYLAKGEANPLLLERTIRYAMERKQSEAALEKANLVLKQELERREQAELALRDANKTLRQQAQELEDQAQELAFANSELRQSEQRFREAVDRFPSIYVIYDPDRRFRFMNQAGLQFSGLTMSDLLGKRDEEIWSEQFTGLYLPKLKQAFATGETQNFEMDQTRSAGTRITQIVSYVPLLDEQKKIRQVLGITLDITERKQAESLNRALNEIHKIIHSSLDFDEVMHLAISAAGRAIGCENIAVSLREGERWVVSYVEGFPQEVVGQMMDDQEARHAVLAIQTKKPVAVSDAFTDERVNRDHMRKWGIRSVLVVPIILRGEAVGVVFFNYQQAPFEFRNPHLSFAAEFAASLSLALENARLYGDLQVEMAERRRTEEDLRQRAEELEKIMDLVPAAIWVAHDPNCFQITGNRVANQFYEALAGENVSAGPEPDKTVGPRRFFYNGRELRADELPMQQAAAENREVPEAEFDVLLPSGKWRTLLGSATPLLNEQNQVRGAIAAFLDITDRVLAEKSMLANAVRLKRSNEELEEFAFVASHEMQEPLRKIEAFSKKLRQSVGQDMSQAERDYLGRIEDAAARMRKMINALLSLSQITSKSTPFTPVDLKQIVCQVLEDQDERIRQTGGAVEIGDLVTVHADPVQMHQLFQNLLGNALKFHRPGMPPVVRVISRSLPGGQVEVSVEDNGIGFHPQDARRLFQPFGRLHGRSEFEGSGFGLAICRKIVERHGGTISARSEPGKGSTFTFILPDGVEAAV